MASEILTLHAARAIALAAQGFDRPRPKGTVGLPHLRRVFNTLGIVQIDFVNVLMPAHYVVPFSRLGPYDVKRFDDLVYRRGECFEQWAHEASILPVDAWPLLRHRMARHRYRPWGFEEWLAEHGAYARRALREVRERGPLSPDELPEPPGERRTVGEAWSRSVQRAVLESYFGRGKMAAVSRRPNFARVYDLAERAIPAEHFTARVPKKEAQRELLRRAARAHGVGTAADLADYYRMSVRDARPLLNGLVRSGELRAVSVEGWRDPAYLPADARVPRRKSAPTALLSPFDPLVWFRPRTERLFGFEYRLEIYVPEPKRRWGYYVLPFMHRGELVARVDLKAERKDGRLAVKAAHLEVGAAATEVARALAEELVTLADWLGLESASVARRGNLANTLRRAL